MATLPSSLYTYYYRSGTNTPDANGDWRWRIYVNESSQNPANNTTTLRFRHYIQFKNQPVGADGRVWICGNRINSGTYSYYQVPYPGIDTPAGDSEILIYTQYRTITHNPDGTKNLYIQGRGGFYTYYTGGDYTTYIYTKNSLFTLTTIPRYATINSYNLTTASMTSLNVSWSANVTCDQVQYRIGSGSWVTAQTGDRKSGNFSITGLNPGTTYSVKIRVRRKDSQLYTESSAKSATTIDKARITSSLSNIDSDSSLTVVASKPDGVECDIKLELPDLGLTEVIRHSDTTNTTFTIEEIQSLADYIPNNTSTTLRITAVTVVDGVDKYWDYKDITYSVVNANPIFNNFEYEDINPITLALTGDNQSIIKGYSNLKATVSLENKAVAQKGANMVKYRLVVGAKQIDVNYDDENAVELTLNAIDNNVFMVYAIDSRNNSTVVQKSPNVYIDYFRPTINNANAERTGGIGDETTLIFNGSFLNIDFGSEENNITIAYKYKKTSDEEYIDGTTTITPIINENNFSFEGKIAGDKGALGFDSQYSYNIKIIATDKLSSDEYDLILGTGKPNMAIHRNGVAINKIYDEVNNPIFDAGRFRVDENGDLQQYDETLEDYIPILEYDVGDILITSTNENPSARYGGNWELIYKKCTWKNIAVNDTGTTYFTKNETNCSAISLYIIIIDNCLYIRLQFTNKVTLSDTACEIGTFNWDAIGLTRNLSLTQFMYAVDDAANGAALVSLALEGIVTSVDVLTKVSGGTIAAGSNLKLTSIVPLRYDSFKDEICDEFHWKKIE